MYNAPTETLKVHIYPSMGEQDNGDGGIRRVIEAQLRHLPACNIELVPGAAEADVIACHVEIPATYARLYPNKPFVLMCHGLYWDEYEWADWALKTNAKAMESMRIADSVIACSKWVGSAIRRHLNRPITVIPHGIDIEDWEGTVDPEAREYVLWNKTRPDPVCDPEPMNEVAKLLPDVMFISTYGNEAPNVAVTGKMPFVDAKRLIQNASVYLCNSRETFGIGTLEALACGVPIVGYKWGGQAEFIQHGKDGWLVQPGDNEGLAEGVRWALANKNRLSEFCRQKAAAYSWSSSAQMYANVFREAYFKKQHKGPRTSIIVTNYNLHAYLKDCLDSVLSQTDKDWECIVVDDGSTDKTGIQIADSFHKKDERFIVWPMERNSYLSEARNIGIREAKGKYILPLDADDMLDPEAVQKLADALDKNKFIHVAYGGVLFVDEDGKTPTNYGNPKGPGFSGWPMPFKFEYQIQQRNLLPYSSMFRKEVWEYTGGYRRRCRTAEDADFWTRISSYGYRPEMVTEDPTLIYRNREGSMSRTNQTDWIKWFPWSEHPELTPAGAVTREQLPIPSMEPVAISVIIPVGAGHGKLVTDAIDSVEAQTFRNWECIVINDTGRPLMSELPSWVRVIETGKPGSGPANARNIGITIAKGKLFLPLDADDYLEPDALRLMYEAYRIDGEVIYSDFWQSDNEGKNFTVHECDDYDPELLAGKKRMFNGQMREGMIHSVTALTPVKAWQEAGGYDEKLPGWEDWDFQLAIADKGYCERRVASPLFFYRKHTGMRREENYNYFDKCKAAIVKKWGRLWQEGGQKLMACTSCSRSRSVSYQQQQAPQQMAAAPADDSAVLVKCISSKMGAIPFKGISRTVYWFASGDSKYVLRQDLPIFEIRPNEFQIVENVPATDTAQPELSAIGQA